MTNFVEGKWLVGKFNSKVNQMKKLILLLIPVTLIGCGKPKEMSDEDYQKYKDLGAPKILYSCTTEGVNSDLYLKCLQTLKTDSNSTCLQDLKNGDNKITSVGYTAGVGAMVTYNEILSNAKSACTGEFKILDSKS